MVAGLLARGEEGFGPAQEGLVRLLGPVDLCSPTFPFEFTTYYEAEMGAHLMRRFLAFEVVADPGGLAVCKERTNDLEAALSRRASHPHRRVVNIDPGYVDMARLVLATTKDYSHRLYIGRGIYAEVTLCYRGGRFEANPWTYPDYRSEPYRAFFEAVRNRFDEKRG